MSWVSSVSVDNHWYCYVNDIYSTKENVWNWLFVDAICGRWRQISASTYHSITRRFGKEYEIERKPLLLLLLLLFNWTASGVLPCGRSPTIRHKTKIHTSHKMSHDAQTKHSTQSYTNKEHITHNEYNRKWLNLFLQQAVEPYRVVWCLGWYIVKYGSKKKMKDKTISVTGSGCP
jgi:hypothetical protein